LTDAELKAEIKKAMDMLEKGDNCGIKKTWKCKSKMWFCWL
jgi:hypothetical protein